MIETASGAEGGAESGDGGEVRGGAGLERLGALRRRRRQPAARARGGVGGGRKPAARLGGVGENLTEEPSEREREGPKRAGRQRMMRVGARWRIRRSEERRVGKECRN